MAFSECQNAKEKRFDEAFSLRVYSVVFVARRCGMKKNLLLVICGLLSLNLFALDKERVVVKQFAKIGNGMWSEMSSPELSVGEIVDLKYAFTVDAKNDARACIDCIIRVPEGLKPELVSASGIQALVLENDGTVAALTTYNEKSWRIYEFLIPQKKAGEGYVEFQVEIPKEFSGKNIHIECMFEHFRNSLLERLMNKLLKPNEVIFVATAVPAAGAVASVATATGLSSVVEGSAVGCVIPPVITYESIKNTIQHIRKHHSSSYKMNDSYAIFTLKIRK